MIEWTIEATGNEQGIQMSGTSDSKQCLACQRSVDEIPLLAVEFGTSRLWICPQHLPVLIHHPERLTEIFEGARDLSGAEDCE